MFAIYYKHKVAGPFEKIEETTVKAWKEIVDSGMMANLPDTAFLNEDMEKYPDDVHILVTKNEEVI